MNAAVQAVRRPHLAMLVGLSMLQSVALNMPAPALPAMARDLATDYATAQLTLTAYLTAVAVGQLVIGPISDRLGRRPIVFAGLVAYLAGSLGGAFASSIEGVIAARIIQALGGGTTFALARAMVRDTAGRDESASIIGYMTMVMVVAPMVSPLIGGVVADRLGWEAVFMVMAGLGAIVTAATVPRLDETRDPANVPASWPDMLRGYRALMREPAFLGYSLAIGFTSATFFCFISGAPYIVVEVMGGDAQTYGLYFLITAFGYMAGNFVSGRFGRRLGAERMVSFGTLASLVSVGLAALAAFVLPWTPATLFLPLILNSFGNGLTLPGATAGALSVKPELAGTAAGLSGSLQLGIGAIGSVIVAWAVPLWPLSLIVIMLVTTLFGWLSFVVGADLASRRRNTTE
jgi:DHA1 family bicyclomycin/chloramphenicol resistance-like MFS transporter